MVELTIEERIGVVKNRLKNAFVAKNPIKATTRLPNGYKYKYYTYYNGAVKLNEAALDGLYKLGNELNITIDITNYKKSEVIVITSPEISNITTGNSIKSCLYNISKAILHYNGIECRIASESNTFYITSHAKTPLDTTLTKLINSAISWSDYCMDILGNNLYSFKPIK